MSIAEHIDLQRRADDLALALEKEGRYPEAILVRTLRSRMHDYRERLDKVATLAR